MRKLPVTLTAAVLLAGCGPQDKGNAAAAKKAAAQFEERAAQERAQAEARIREQEARASRWQFAAMLAFSGAAFALIIGTVIGSRAHHDAGK